MKIIDVYADVAYPFAHVGLRRITAERDAIGRQDVAFRVRAWPLEMVNGHAEAGSDLAPKVKALRDSVAPELFRGFEPETFPSSSLPALAWEAKAYARDVSVGEQFSLLVRTALFEDGLDIADESSPACTRAWRLIPQTAPNFYSIGKSESSGGSRAPRTSSWTTATSSVRP